MKKYNKRVAQGCGNGPDPENDPILGLSIFSRNSQMFRVQGHLRKRSMTVLKHYKSIYLVHISITWLRFQLSTALVFRATCNTCSYDVQYQRSND